MSRRTTRECAMKMLYSYSITGEMLDPFKTTEVTEDSICDIESDANSEDIDYLKTICSDFMNKEDEIDEAISRNSHSWRIERINKVDLAILRLAVFEMQFMKTPYKVVINEAVELAKEYSAEKSYRFVNGLLGGFVKNELTDK